MIKLIKREGIRPFDPVAESVGCVHPHVYYRVCREAHDPAHELPESSNKVYTSPITRIRSENIQCVIGTRTVDKS